MAGLADFRAQHPEYNDMSDTALADALYRKFYSDMPREQFDQRMGVAPQIADLPNPRASRTEAVLRGAAQGATVNLADEIVGGGAQRAAQFNAAMQQDRLKAMAEAAQRGDWETYRNLQRETFQQGQESGQQARDKYRERDAAVSADRPGYFMGGELAGAIGTGALTMGSASPSALMAGKGLIPRMATGAAEGAAYGAAYGAGGATEGKRTSGALAGGVAGGIGGAVMPAIGAGVRKGAEKIVSGYRHLTNPTRAAQSEIAQAMMRDARSSGHALREGDMAVARMNGQPVMNADMGGESTRMLARTAANKNPEVWGAIDRATSDRFATQGNRAVSLLNRVTNGAVDDVAIRDGLEAAARKANKGAYDAAYAFNFGKSHPMVLDQIQERIPAAAVRNALRVAKAEGRPFGEQLIASIDDAGDRVVFRRAPSLREWDYIQRGLRSATDQAYRSGAGEVGTSYRSLRKELLGVLDEANPYFKKARQGAAKAFGAEDALDAGRQFAKSSRNTLEMQKAIKDMNKSEKELFASGFASELIDKIKSTRDRSNVITAVFGNQESRQKMVMAFGENKAREIETFVRIEGAMDMLRGALGNSSTVRQAIAAGALGGGGYGLVTGDWSTAAGIGAMLAGGRAASPVIRDRLDQRVQREIGRILLSGDEKEMTRLIKQAAASKTYMENIRAVTDKVYRIALPTVGVGAGALANQ